VVIGYLSSSIAELVREKSLEILREVGFCVPDQGILARLEGAGFPADRESHMVRVTPELLEAALGSLPQDLKLYDRLPNVAPASWGPAHR
jgi:trimethylamine:corrinoid methyltransferase-like protein